MIFNVSVPDLINTFIISAGIGICVMIMQHITFSVGLSTELKKFARFFFIVLTMYLSLHLARQLMNGMAGDVIRVALYIVTTLEVFMAGFMAYMFSRMLLVFAKTHEKEKHFSVPLNILICVHSAVLVGDWFGHFIYRFDEDNIYERSSLYILSNVCPILMLMISAFLLIRYRDNIKKQIRTAFWVYIISPLIAIVIQSFSYGVQFIMLASVIGAVYMFSAIIREQTEKFENQRLEKSRIESELNLATNIQAGMLPNMFPAFPERPEFDIYASMDPAKEVGGDFYDFFMIDDDHLAMVIGDVSGKGVPAALFMMASKITINDHALMGGTPAEILQRVNKQICSANDAEMFVTVWLGILEISTGKLTAASAGHEYPMLNINGKYELFKDKHGLAVGAMDIAKYKDYEITLKKGDSIFVYTDGVAEATDAQNELFGTDRTLDALNNLPGNDTQEEILKGVRKAVDAFVKEAPQFDDLTMLGLKYFGTGEEK
ncbi:MAG: PP2C family protein-serine/threonine phosphatase [Ruminiclostridium sp.]|nr:PP2C family protein-serine/threonine phosphatase [Ruminiclostridium sp.]